MGESHDDDECEYRDEHPSLRTRIDDHDRRLAEIERLQRDQEKTRMSDYQAYTKLLGEVHEKVNDTSRKLEAINGWKSGSIFMVGILFTLISLAVQFVFKK